MIRLVDATLSAGGRDLLVDATLHVRPGDKIGIVGRNGAGKTTLLRALLGELTPDHGSVQRRGGLSMGYLPQQAVSGSSLTLWEEARSGMTRLNALAADLAAATEALAQGKPGAVERHATVEDTWRLAGGYAADERVGEVLHGLGFRSADWHRPCAELSGGWQMRVALARLLLSDAELLLLDEPTNHLDILARTWLARFLAGADRAAVMVSHDRHLLDRVSNRTVEIRSRKLHGFSGNLSAWLLERDARFHQQEAAWDAQQAEIQRMERFVNRFRAQANKASQAQSRVKALARMELVDEPERASRPRIRLPEPTWCSQVALELREATAGWPGGPQVFAGLDLALERGMRLAVLGPNGCGKSTLIHALVGRLPLRAGRRLTGEGVRPGLFTQDLAADLDPDQSGLDHLGMLAPEVPTSRAWALLGALGLSGELAQRPLGTLSGGEKARVALAGLAVRPHNTLLLDEPTNHLDAVTVEVLVEGLSAWEGALLVVTHDRYLVEQVATHVLKFTEAGPVLSVGVRPEDFEVGAWRPEDREREVAVSTGGDSYAERKKRKREAERARRRIGTIEAEIADLEAKMNALDEAMAEVAADYQRAATLEEERGGLQARVDALFEEWEGLEAS